LRLQDQELLALITAYKTNPSNPIATGALLGALDGMTRYLTRTRAASLGGPADAKQDVIVATLTVCQEYDLEQATGVELNLLGNIADALVGKVRRGVKTLTNEVLTDELPERISPALSLAGIDLALAVTRKIIRRVDLPLLNARYLDGKTYNDIAKAINEKKPARKVTAQAVKRRIQKAAERLQRWASEGK
jgi:hypothetical protein